MLAVTPHRIPATYSYVACDHAPQKKYIKHLQPSLELTNDRSSRLADDHLSDDDKHVTALRRVGAGQTSGVCFDFDTSKGGIC